MLPIFYIFWSNFFAHVKTICANKNDCETISAKYSNSVNISQKNLGSLYSTKPFGPHFHLLALPGFMSKASSIHVTFPFVLNIRAKRFVVGIIISSCFFDWGSMQHMIYSFHSFESTLVCLFHCQGIFVFCKIERRIL